MSEKPNVFNYMYDPSKQAFPGGAGSHHMVVLNCHTPNHEQIVTIRVALCDSFPNLTDVLVAIDLDAAGVEVEGEIDGEAVFAEFGTTAVTIRPYDKENENGEIHD